MCRNEHHLRVIQLEQHQQHNKSKCNSNNCIVQHQMQLKQQWQQQQHNQLLQLSNIDNNVSCSSSLGLTQEYPLLDESGVQMVPVAQSSFRPQRLLMSGL